MSARINLAPEVYQKHQHEKQLRRTVAGGVLSLTTAFGIAIGVLVVIVGGQAAATAALTNTIHDKQGKIKTYSNLTDAVTINDHLQSINQLHSTQVYPSKFFEALQTYLPQGISLASASIDPSNNLTVSASATSYPLVTKLAKAFQGANVTVGSNAAATNQPYFSNVQINSASRNGGDVTFQMSTQLSSEIEINGNK